MPRFGVEQSPGGFTLTELMITVAVGGMLVLGSAEVVKTFSGGQKSAMQAFEFDSLTSEIFQYLSKPAQCTAGIEEAVAQNPKFCQRPPAPIRIKRAGGTAFYVGLPQDKVARAEGLSLSAAITECKADPKRPGVRVTAVLIREVRLPFVIRTPLIIVSTARPTVEAAEGRNGLSRDKHLIAFKTNV